jgi:acetyltransferase-like isoleucine patch superfamily enzyme
MFGIKDYIKDKLARLYKPRMIAGYTNAQGRFLRKVRIANTTFIDHPEMLEIEDLVFIGHHNFLEASNGLHIGEGVQITNFVSITTHSSHHAIRLYGRHYDEMAADIAYIKGPVNIGAFTFVGPHSLIMPNTKIGKGSIVAAYSYVQGEFPDFAILQGNPAVVVGDTRDKDQGFLTENPTLQSFYDEWVTR